MATVDASLFLFLSVIGKLAGSSDDYINLLKTSITVLVSALAKLAPFVTQNKSKITETYGKCELALMTWVAKRSIIGGSIFGGSVNEQGKPGLKHASSELEVYVQIHVLLTTVAFNQPISLKHYCKPRKNSVRYI